MRLYLIKEYFTTKSSTIQGTYHKTTVNNLYNIQQHPYIIITFLSASTNPTIYFKNSGVETAIQITGSFVTNDKLYLDCRSKIAKKNSLIINLTTFPIINKQSFYELYISSTVASFTIKYKTYEDKEFYTKYREDFSLNNANKKVSLPKRFYNSTNRESIILSNDVSFDFSVPMKDDYWISMINTTDTYRIEFRLDNDDDDSKIERVLCGCNLDVAMSGSGSDLVKWKVSGTGILLEEVS